MAEKICAIIVTYNSGPEVRDGVASVVGQTHKIIISDNGSSTETIAILKKIEDDYSPQVKVLRSPNNLGIAAALNNGARLALKEGCDWVLTLDDDSVVESDMVRKMLEAYKNLADSEKKCIAVIAPNYTILKGLAYSARIPVIVPVAITSGQLVKTSAFQTAGFYREDLFIECVDHEFCLRLLRRGLKTFLVPGAILKQRIGRAPELRRILRKKFVVSHHFPHRYYYLYRNSVFLYKNYWRVAPGWIVKNMLSNVAVLLKMIFFEDKRPSKIQMVVRGCADALFGKYGKLKTQK